MRPTRSDISRVLLLTVAVLCAGGLVTAAQAQKTAPQITRDTDRDGVPDGLDRCRQSPAGSRVDATGCPAPPPAPQQQAAAPPPAAAPVVPPPGPAPVTTPAATPGGGTPAGGAATPPAGQNAAAQPPAPNPPATSTVSTQAAVPAGPVVVPGPSGSTPAGRPATPNAGTPAPAVAPAREAPAPVTDPTMTAGYWMPVYTGTTDAAQLEYFRTLTLKLDSAVLALVENFRGTSGTPIAGANNPGVLSAREKRRWGQCRLIHYDLISIDEAVKALKDSMAGGPTVGRAVANLDDAFEALTATGECDNLGSMIESPDRWQPWQTNYESSARGFYGNWYTQLRTLHEADRSLARALLPTVPAGRTYTVPSGIAVRAPTVGSGR